MNQKTFITSIEREKCSKIVNAYKELFDNEDIAVIDAGKYDNGRNLPASAIR